MNEEMDVDKLILDAERQLRYTQSEIKKIDQELARLREERETTEQKEIEAKSAAGEDVLDFEPSRELRALKMAIDRYEQNLENFQQKEVDTQKQIDNLKTSRLETQLLQQSKVVVELKKREADILEQLKEVQQEIEAAEAVKAELAIMVADHTDG